MQVEFTTKHAEGAWENGLRVVKANSEEGDGHEDGALATILGSIGPAPHPKTGEMLFGYFVKWDDFPFPVFIAGDGRIQLVEGDDEPS